MSSHSSCTSDVGPCWYMYVVCEMAPVKSASRERHFTLRAAAFGCISLLSVLYMQTVECIKYVKLMEYGMVKLKVGNM